VPNDADYVGFLVEILLKLGYIMVLRQFNCGQPHALTRDKSFHRTYSGERVNRKGMPRGDLRVSITLEKSGCATDTFTREG
jgi:hypothetical protein